MVDYFVVKIFLWKDGLDYMFHEVGRNSFISDIFTVLSRDNNGVNTFGNWYTINKLILAGNLSLSIRADPVTYTIFTAIIWT